ncbi:hypothetical protein IFM89_022924 [Coptis chinensis]|uniref:Uncharacterized protein n=1 Tax=Coptis chinensis TaxID=261450 RepID=A0A835IPJ5_9MAGN|nr:hypothetical protein IFM89_022924 [Coptis chinensis]
MEEIKWRQKSKEMEVKEAKMYGSKKEWERNTKYSHGLANARNLVKLMNKMYVRWRIRKQLPYMWHEAKIGGNDWDVGWGTGAEIDWDAPNPNLGEPLWEAPSTEDTVLRIAPTSIVQAKPSAQSFPTQHPQDPDSFVGEGCNMELNCVDWDSPPIFDVCPEEDHDSFLDTPPIFDEYGADESEFCVTTSLSGNLFVEYADPVWEDFDINYTRLFSSVHLKLQLEGTKHQIAPVSKNTSVSGWQFNQLAATAAIALLLYSLRDLGCLLLRDMESTTNVEGFRREWL